MSKQKQSDDLPIHFFENQQAWEQWLGHHHASSPGVRLQIAKKQSGLTSVSYDEALEVALCYGWIDSRKETCDDKTWLQRFTPRGPQSIWSKVNKEKAERLIAGGRMKPAGLAAIETAKRNGQWDKAYEPSSSASLPDDFEAALLRNEKAKAFYETLDKRNKYAITFRIQSAKKAETRTKRIEQFISMLERQEKIYP
ncbi:YdeI/OmpD-associated family protein [Paenibacillus thermotolerans]|uniref:YdeI/OmpD-associated family protein n=1 Tax=Paenibacillus thermotolerans TaxID=3027807 RepID=UPI0023682616|nr:MULTISPECIES: YdeI/OmpD-associated family protein [unclassified Paenibacillus]